MGYLTNFLLSALSICKVYAQEGEIQDTFSEARSTGTGKEILDGWNVELQLVAQNEMEITIVARDNSWVGIILGGHEIEDVGNDLIVVSANGKESYCFINMKNLN